MSRNLKEGNREIEETYQLPFCLIRPKAKVEAVGTPDKLNV
jgi:hypothetical protein